MGLLILNSIQIEVDFNSNSSFELIFWKKEGILMMNV